MSENPSTTAKKLSLPEFRKAAYPTTAQAKPAPKSKFETPVLAPRAPVSAASDAFVVVSVEPSSFLVFCEGGVEQMSMAQFQSKTEQFFIADLTLSSGLHTSYLVALTTTKNLIFFRMKMEEGKVRASRLPLRYEKVSERTCFSWRRNMLYIFDQNFVKRVTFKEYETKKTDYIDFNSLLEAPVAISSLAVSPKEEALYVVGQNKLLSYTLGGEKTFEMVSPFPETIQSFQVVSTKSGDYIVCATEDRQVLAFGPHVAPSTFRAPLPHSFSSGSRLIVSNSGRVLALMNSNSVSLSIFSLDFGKKEFLGAETELDVPSESTAVHAHFKDKTENLCVMSIRPDINEVFLVPTESVLSIGEPKEEPKKIKQDEEPKDFDFENLELTKKEESVGKAVNLAELEKALAAKEGDAGAQNQKEGQAKKQTQVLPKKTSDLESKEAQAKMLSEILTNFHDNLMKKLNNVFDHTRDSFSKELEQSIINQYKLQEASLLEKFTKQSKEQFLPHVQKAFESLLTKYNSGLEKSFTAFINKNSMERDCVRGFAESLKEGISANVECSNQMRDSLSRIFEDGGLLTEAKESPEAQEPQEEKVLLERILSQQTQILEQMSSLSSRLTSLEKSNEQFQAAPPLPQQPVAPQPFSARGSFHSGAEMQRMQYPQAFPPEYFYAHAQARPQMPLGYAPFPQFEREKTEKPPETGHYYFPYPSPGAAFTFADPGALAKEGGDFARK